MNVSWQKSASRRNEDKMDVKEIRDKRMKLEATLLELIGSFERETGVAVTEIALSHVLQIRAPLPVPVLTGVNVRVNLDA